MKHPFEGIENHPHPEKQSGSVVARREIVKGLAVGLPGLMIFGCKTTAGDSSSVSSEGPQDPSRVATTLALGEEGGQWLTTMALGEEGGGVATTQAVSEEGGSRQKNARTETKERDKAKSDLSEFTTTALNEEGGDKTVEEAKATTMALGEEGGAWATTKAQNEEGGSFATTMAVGEEGGERKFTTLALGEEGAAAAGASLTDNGGSKPIMTTLALGEEGGKGKDSIATTKAMGEEGGGRVMSTQAQNEEGGGSVTTWAMGEEGADWASTQATAEEGGSRITTLALNEEGSTERLATTQAVGEEGGEDNKITTMALGEEGGAGGRNYAEGRFALASKSISKALSDSAAALKKSNVAMAVISLVETGKGYLETDEAVTYYTLFYYVSINGAQTTTKHTFPWRDADSDNTLYYAARETFSYLWPVESK